MKKLFTLCICFLSYFIQSQTANSIYGMAVKTGPQTFLGKINPATGVVTNISATSLGPNYIGSLGVIDPKKNKYYYENGSNQFIGIDLVTGTVTTNPTLSFSNGASFFDLPAYNCKDSSIYGIARKTGPTAYYLGKINPLTGLVTAISTSSVGNGTILTPSTLDPINKRFYFEDGSFEFVSIDLTTGTIVAMPAITYPNTNANLFDCFVWNCADTAIYGLARKNSPAQMYLSKINPYTGMVTYISASSINPNGQTSGGATIDVANKIFYFQDGNQNLLGISMVTGNIVTNPPVTNSGANSFTNFRSTNLCSCAISTGIKENIEAGFKVGPNPFNDNLQITLHSITDNVTAKLLDISGKVILEKKLSSVNSFNLETGNIPSGVYFMEVTLNGNVSRLKVVKD